MDTPVANQPQPTQSESELQKLQRQADEYLKGWQRAKADYSNFKKQAEREKEEMVQFANAALLLQLLPIYDHFKRALEHVPMESQQTEWVKGVGHIRSQFQGFFKTLGIEEIPTVNQLFDPSQHEAIAREQRPGVTPDTVVEELSTGFTFRGKVLIPAKVKVSAE